MKLNSDLVSSELLVVPILDDSLKRSCCAGGHDVKGDFSFCLVIPNSSSFSL